MEDGKIEEEVTIPGLEAIWEVAPESTTQSELPRGECHRAEGVGEGLRIPSGPGRRSLHARACCRWDIVL